NQPVQSADQSLQFNQLYQSQMNFCPEPSYYLKRLTSIITTPMDVKRRRPIIIDGLNIGYSHGLHKKFSARGILLCAQFFMYQGFESVEVMLPVHYRGAPGTETYTVLSMLMNIGRIHFTPSRKIQNVRLTCYSDRIILDYAYICGGVVVSNDNFRDIYNESEHYKEIIENRHLMYMFIGDDIFFPKDQYGHLRPNLYAFDIVHFPA
ncbi:PREDICTED: probable ribonuclease ZC3H12D, partial [Diuraphis noxia]|uniref:probable ribonuclease ZC3H12D n=1 Tax=Diuraphis noxia TaxID=143948 RepID=UPI00076398B8